MFLQHLQDIIVSSLSSNMQGSHKALRHNRQEVMIQASALLVDTVFIILPLLLFFLALNVLDHIVYFLSCCYFLF